MLLVFCFPLSREDMIEGYNWRQITEQADMEYICRKIHEGIFSNERYSIVPGFNTYKCNRRMAYWLKDWFLEKKIILNEVLNDKGEGIAFFSYVPIDSFRVEGHLCGVYVTQKKEYSGVWLALIERKYYKSMGIKQSVSHFSSNNLAILRLEGKLGTQIRNIRYYFSKLR